MDIDDPTLNDLKKISNLKKQINSANCRKRKIDAIKSLEN